MNRQKRGHHLTQHDCELSSEKDGQMYHHYQNNSLEKGRNYQYHLDGEAQNSSMLALKNDENVPNHSTPKAPKKKTFFKNTAKRMKIFGSVKKKKSSDADSKKHLVVLSETLSGETAEFVTVDNSFDQGIGRKSNKSKKKDKRKKPMAQGCESVEGTIDFSNGVPTSVIDHNGIPEPGMTFRSPLLSVEASLRKKVRHRRMVDIAFQGPQSQSLQHELQPALSNNYSMEMVPGHRKREANTSGMRSIQEVAMKRSTITYNNCGEVKGGITEVGDHAVALSNEMKLQARNAHQQGIRVAKNAMRNHETGNRGKCQKIAHRNPNAVNHTGEAMTAVSELSMGSPMAKFDRERLQYLLNQSNVPMAKADNLEAPAEETVKRKQVVESPLVQRTRSEYGFCTCPTNNFDYGEVINMERIPNRGKRKIQRNDSIASYDNSSAKESHESYSTGTDDGDFSIECKNILKTASTLTSNSSDASQDPSDGDESCSVSTGPPDFHSIIYDVTSRISSKKSQIQRKIPNSVSDASAATRRAVQSFRGRLAECIAPVAHSPPSLKARTHHKR